jgi:hypothetical protein
MQVFDSTGYIAALTAHYETYYYKKGKHLNLESGPPLGRPLSIEVGDSKGRLNRAAFTI